MLQRYKGTIERFIRISWKEVGRNEKVLGRFCGN